MKNYDLFFIKMVVNISIKLDKVQDLIDLILDNKEFYNIV